MSMLQHYGEDGMPFPPFPEGADCVMVNNVPKTRICYGEYDDTNPNNLACKGGCKVRLLCKEYTADFKQLQEMKARKKMYADEIVKDWLIQRDYDGLYNESTACACTIDDLAPCGSMNAEECIAGWKIPCPGGEDCDNDGDCDFHISSDVSDLEKRIK